MITPLLYLAAVVGTNVAFAAVGPVPLTFVLAGLALVARDGVHEAHGRRGAGALVLIGTALSALLAGPGIALASGVAFLVAEVLDLAVYDAVRRRSIALGVLLSGLVGSVVDSLLFLSLAFGSLAFLGPQVTGKVAATVGAAGVVWAVRRARR